MTFKNSIPVYHNIDYVENYVNLFNISMKSR